eukprot:TCONS_00003681-protein
MCLSPYEKDLCVLSKTWLPRNRLAQIFTYGGSNYLVNILFKTDIHKLLLGLVRNHNWDPFNAFKEVEVYTCGKKKNINLYLWTNNAMDKGEYFGHQLLLEIYSRVFTKANVFHVDDIMNLVTEIDKKLYSEDLWGTLETRMTDKKMKEYFKHQHGNGSIIFHINYQGIEVIIEGETPWKRNKDLLSVGKVIDVIVVDNVTKTPFLQNGDIITNEDDLMSYDFFKLLIERINFVLCQME